MTGADTFACCDTHTHTDPSTGPGNTQARADYIHTLFYDRAGACGCARISAFCAWLGVVFLCRVAYLVLPAASPLVTRCSNRCAVCVRCEPCERVTRCTADTGSSTQTGRRSNILTLQTTQSDAYIAYARSTHSPSSLEAVKIATAEHLQPQKCALVPNTASKSWCSSVRTASNVP